MVLTEPFSSSWLRRERNAMDERRCLSLPSCPGLLRGKACDELFKKGFFIISDPLTTTASAPETMINKHTIPTVTNAVGWHKHLTRHARIRSRKQRSLLTLSGDEVITTQSTA